MTLVVFLLLLCLIFGVGGVAKGIGWFLIVALCLLIAAAVTGRRL